jgi:hypothetical protein
LWSAFDVLSGHRRRYTRRERVAKMTAAGFRVVAVTSFVSLLLPLVILARLSRRKVTLAQELQVRPLVNRVLLCAGTLERAIIGAGVSLPLGGSLLAVGLRRQ